MTNAIQLFNYGDNPVRTIEQDGEVWFVAKDICDILDIKNARDAIKSLDDDEKMASEIATPSNGGHSKLNLISESGLYALVFKSLKPEAKEFRRWVTGTVLPQIRKTGAYSIQQEQPTTKALPDANLRAEIDNVKKRIAFYQETLKAYMTFERSFVPKEYSTWPTYTRDDYDDLHHMADLLEVFKSFALDRMRNLEEKLKALETLAKF